MTDQAAQGESQIPLKWQFPENLVTRFANNFVVQHTDKEFIINFFEVHAPVIFGSPEKRQEELAQLECIPAECVARIALAPGRIPELIDVLQKNLAKFDDLLMRDRENE